MQFNFEVEPSFMTAAGADGSWQSVGNLVGEVLSGMTIEKPEVFGRQAVSAQSAPKPAGGQEQEL